MILIRTSVAASAVVFGALLAPAGGCSSPSDNTPTFQVRSGKTELLESRITKPFGNFSLTIEQTSDTAPNNLCLQVEVMNFGPETFDWDREFVANLVWRVNIVGPGQQVTELVAHERDHPTDKKRFVRIGSGDRRPKVIRIDSLYRRFSRTNVRPGDNGGQLSFEYERFVIPRAARTIQVMVEYRSGHFTSERARNAGVALPPGEVPSNALEIVWR